jgi:hypothetical protein
MNSLLPSSVTLLDKSSFDKFFSYSLGCNFNISDNFKSSTLGYAYNLENLNLWNYKNTLNNYQNKFNINFFLDKQLLYFKANYNVCNTDEKIGGLNFLTYTNNKVDYSLKLKIIKPNINKNILNELVTNNISIHNV